MGRLIGYARVSTGDQDLKLQLDALKTAGCRDVDIYTDKASGARASRPGLDACVKALEPRDTLVVWRLDRLGRSMPHLVALVEELLGKGIGFRSLSGRRHRHHHGVGRVDVQYLLEPGTVRAAPDPGANPCRLGRSPGAGRLGGRRPISPDDPRVVTAKRLHKDRSLTTLRGSPDACKKGAAGCIPCRTRTPNKFRIRRHPGR